MEFKQWEGFLGETWKREINVSNFIKKNYKVINTVCGIFLVVIGVLMMTGLMNRFLTILS